MGKVEFFRKLEMALEDAIEEESRLDPGKSKGRGGTKGCLACVFGDDEWLGRVKEILSNCGLDPKVVDAAIIESGHRRFFKIKWEVDSQSRATKCVLVYPEVTLYGCTSTRSFLDWLAKILD